MNKRLGLILALGAVAVAAAGIGIASCGGGGGSGGCQPGQAACNVGDPCTANADCRAGLSCNTTTNKCEEVFVCTADSQCDATRNPVCTSAGKCICLEGACQERGCSTDAVCQGGQICISGKCAARPSSSGLLCEVVTPDAVTRQGQTVQFAAIAKNANGAIVVGQTFTWKSSNTSAATIDASGVATGGTTTGTTNITCQVSGGSATDSMPVMLQNYANPAGTDVRAVVIDEITGKPVQGATVMFMNSGGQIGSNQTTAADGSASVTGDPPVSVHVFHSGYQWLSIMGVNQRDVLVPLAPTPDTTKAGGFKGVFDFSTVVNQSDTVEFGLAGASIGGSFVNLDFTTLIGESIKTRVKIGQLFDDDVNLPSGLFLKLGAEPIKGEFQAQGQQGTRHRWAIGGKVPFDKLLEILTPIIGGGGGVDSIPFGPLLAQILPFFDKFRHFVQANQMVDQVAKVTDVNDIDGDMMTNDLVPDYGNASAFPTITAKVDQALSLSTAVTVPNLPQYNGKFLEGAIVLAGANAAGRGLVPLGISAGVDAPGNQETPDGKVDVDPNTAGNQSTLSFKLAPLHSGLEGSKFFFATLAINLALSESVAAQVAGIITQTDTIETSTSLGATFLNFPEAATFNTGTRTFALGTPVSGATFYRADFTGADNNAGWAVYFKSGSDWTLPAPPGGMMDRAVVGGNTSLRVFSLQTRAVGGGGAPTLDDAAAFGSVNLSRLNDFIASFSNTQCQTNGSCAAPPPSP